MFYATRVYSDSNGDTRFENVFIPLTDAGEIGMLAQGKGHRTKNLQLKKEDPFLLLLNNPAFILLPGDRVQTSKNNYMTILVPTDFSEVANVAIRYAAMLARKLGARIILFHAVPHNSVWWSTTNNELVLEARQIQRRIKDELLSAGVEHNKIEMHVFYQFPLNIWINDFIRKNKIDFAVIGTKVGAGLKNVTLGSFALGMIDHVSIPIIAVPPSTNAKDLNVILYPTDLEHTIKEAKRLLPFVKTLDCQLHIVHISEGNMGENLKAAEKLRKMAARLDFEKLTVQVKRGTELPLTIAETIKEHQADLLVMFPAEKGYLEQLIKGSVTEETSYHIRYSVINY